jgi:hypothetical protein
VVLPYIRERSSYGRIICAVLKWLYMAIERTVLDSLQHRVDQIRATGNDDLAARAWRALSQVLFNFTRAAHGQVGADVPPAARVNADDVRRLLARLAG